MPVPVVEALRALPHARAAIDALAPEPGVHVVGGAVRDVLLGRPPAELDFVVVGDAPGAARRAAGRLGGHAVVHERFGTATVHAGERSFDLAATRRELYPVPGALPDVELGASLRDDLERRDFTVNAIAARLADGELIPVADALEDLETRRLRVLHAHSFADDPTRLLRMCRYAARLGFAPEPATAELAAAAVVQGALQTVSGERLGRELRLLAREPQPAGLVALADHGLQAALHPALRVDAGRVAAAIGLCPVDGRPDLIALAACLLDAPGGELAARLAALAFPAGDRDLVVTAATRACGVARALTAAAAAAPSALARAVERERVETVALAGALIPGTPGEAAARAWLDRLRHLALAIDGRDLEAAGLRGPAVGQGLRAARAAALDGRAPDAERQLAAALAAVRAGA